MNWLVILRDLLPIGPRLLLLLALPGITNLCSIDDLECFSGLTTCKGFKFASVTAGGAAALGMFVIVLPLLLLVFSTICGAIAACGKQFPELEKQSST